MNQTLYTIVRTAGDDSSKDIEWVPVPDGGLPDRGYSSEELEHICATLDTMNGEGSRIMFNHGDFEIHFTTDPDTPVPDHPVAVNG